MDFLYWSTIGRVAWLAALVMFHGGCQVRTGQWSSASLDSLICLLILIIDMRSGCHSVFISQLQIVSNCILLFSKLSWNWLVIVDGVLHLNPFILFRLFLQLLTLLIKVLLSESDVTSDHL